MHAWLFAMEERNCILLVDYIIDYIHFFCTIIGQVHNMSPLLQQQPQQNHAPPPNHNVGPPHHVLNPNRNSMYSSDSDLEDESPFAKALREKKLKKTSSVHTR